MKVKVELGNDEVKEMLRTRLRELMPEVEVDDADIKITVRSKQNFRDHEWENGEIKVEYNQL